MITNDAKCACKIKSRITRAKAAINKKKNLFHQQITLKFKKENSKVVQMQNGFVGC